MLNCEMIMNIMIHVTILNHSYFSFKGNPLVKYLQCIYTKPIIYLSISKFTLKTSSHLYESLSMQTRAEWRIWRLV